MKDALTVKVGLVCLVGVFALVGARAQSLPGVDVRKAMNAQEYKDAGLDKLSPNETAARLDTTAATISRWKARFLKGRIAGLTEVRHAGKKPFVVTPALTAKVIGATRRQPKD